MSAAINISLALSWLALACILGIITLAPVKARQQQLLVFCTALVDTPKLVIIATAIYGWHLLAGLLQGLRWLLS